MRKIQNILVPTDFTASADNAFEYANHLAKEFGAKITVLHVYSDEYLNPTPHILRRSLLQERKELAQKKIWRYVHSNAPNLPEGDQVSILPAIDINTMVKGGNPAEAIALITERESIDLVVIGTRDEHKTKDRLLGSVATYVGRHANCPVLVIPNQVKFQPPKHIAYASDLSDGDLMDMQSLVYWAGRFRSKIHWVHVETQKGAITTSGEEFEQIFQINAPALEVGFTKIEAPDLHAGLDQFVNDKQIDVLVMHPHRNKVFENVFKGSATKKMVHRAQVPILLFHD